MIVAQTKNNYVSSQMWRDYFRFLAWQRTKPVSLPISHHKATGFLKANGMEDVAKISINQNFCSANKK